MCWFLHWPTSDHATALTVISPSSGLLSPSDEMPERTAFAATFTPDFGA